MDHGVDLTTKSILGITAAQVAKMRGHDHLVELLVARGAPPPVPFDANDVMTAWLAERSVDSAPGIAALVARDGQVIWTGSCGMADLSHEIPITRSTKFRIGSITKQFTGAAILKLQEEGRLSVDDKLSKFMPDFPRGDEVTIHHLLTHTSGIKSYTSKPGFLDSAAAAATEQQMIDTFRDEPFDFDPGSKFAYNNSGYFLLGTIVAQVSGQSYGDYLHDAFFEPLGMHDTGVHASTAVLRHEATGYSYEQGKTTQALNWDMSQAGAAGSLYSTVDDLMRWNEGLFGGNVLKPDSLQAAFTPVELPSDEEPMMAYGYGWLMGTRRGLQTIGHSGGLQGWLSQITRYPAQNLTVVVLHNAMPPVPQLTPGEVSDWLADAFLWPEMKPHPHYEVDTSVDPATFTAYVGRYDYLSAVMDIALDGTQLTAQLAGQPRFPIFPMGGDRFFWKVVDAQVEFLRNDEGQVVSVRHTQGGRTFVAKRLADQQEVNVAAEQLDRYVGQVCLPGPGGVIGSSRRRQAAGENDRPAGVSRFMPKESMCSSGRSSPRRSSSSWGRTARWKRPFIDNRAPPSTRRRSKERSRELNVVGWTIRHAAGILTVAVLAALASVIAMLAWGLPTYYAWGSFVGQQNPEFAKLERFMAQFGVGELALIAVYSDDAFARRHAGMSGATRRAD